MFRNVHNPSGSTPQARNPAARRRTVFVALVFALVIAGAGQPAPAQPVPAGKDEISFKLEVFPEKLPTFCVNQKFTFYAGVSKTVNKVINDKNVEIPGNAPAPAVSGSVTDRDIGTLLGFEDEENTFLFTAKKPGTTTLKFTALVKNIWIGANEEVIGSSVKIEKPVTVKVRNCKYKVETVSQFSAQGVKLASTMEGEMESDEQGNFTGSATVNWVGGVASIGDCSAAYYDVASSQADLTGNQDDSGQLAAEVNYLGAVITMSGCASASGTMIPDPLTLSVPSSGGVSTQSQNLHEPNYFSFYGSVVIVVIPVEDEAAAFNADKPVSWVGTPSLSGWAVRWDDFPWIFGAFVGLAITHAFKRRKKTL